MRAGVGGCRSQCRPPAEVTITLDGNLVVVTANAYAPVRGSMGSVPGSAAGTIGGCPYTLRKYGAPWVIVRHQLLGQVGVVIGMLHLMITVWRRDDKYEVSVSPPHGSPWRRASP
jgi:hypothetical protein